MLVSSGRAARIIGQACQTVVMMPRIVGRGACSSSSATAREVVSYDEFLTARSRRRKPSAIRALQPFTSIPGMVSLGGGMPNPALFPFAGMSLTFPDGATVGVDKHDLQAALQYSATPGLPELVSRLAVMQAGEHAPPRKTSIAVTPGSQDGLAKIFDMLVDEGDSLVIEAPTYSGSLAHLEATGCNLATVATDEHGLIPERLDELLSTWDERVQGRKPKAAYIIATGSNPTGASLSLERKKHIYSIAQTHNLIIIEDDPYYYLQYSMVRTPSFLSLDTDGRVIRCDSFSKILSAGIRIGVVTGPEALVERVNLHNQSSILHTSGVSQLMTLALFRHWNVGENGAVGANALGQLTAHLKAVREFYSKQCDSFLASASRHLRRNADGSGELLAEFSRPSAGMFVWMKLKGVDDTFDLITKEAVAKKVLLVPGSAFYPGNPKTPYVRAAFSTATAEQMDTAMQRLGELLRSRLEPVEE